MVGTEASKGQLLQEEGYAYNFDCMVYFNPKTRKVFSVEFVEDHDEDQIRKCINERINGTRWYFYFNSSPSDSVRRELQTVLR